MNPIPIALVPLALLGYVVIGRPWQLTWGATPAEVARALPGDTLIPRPTFNATRAITIAEPPAAVFPWLVQVGVTRGGWYSYDLLDNLGRPSARTIVPELQTIAPGDILAMSPDGKQGMQVHSLSRPSWMVWSTPGDTSWAWQLDEIEPGSTRVVTRIRSRIRWSPMSIAFSALLEVVDIWMLRKMLFTIRDRAETAGATPRHDRAPQTAPPLHGDQPA